MALVIHDRDAHDDVLRVLREEGAPERTVFHCFSGDAEMARDCVRAGYVLSFAGTVTFKNAPELREAAAVVPLDQLLVETDAPFLTPMPYRGRPNAPYLVPLTVRALAERARVSTSNSCASESPKRASGCSGSGNRAGTPSHSTWSDAQGPLCPVPNGREQYASAVVTGTARNTDKPTPWANPQWTTRSSDRPQWTPPGARAAGVVVRGAGRRRGADPAGRPVRT